jgi:hypothetical protein
MPQCKDCSFFQAFSQKPEHGFCTGHEVSVQEVPSEMDTNECPIQNFKPKG